MSARSRLRAARCIESPPLPMKKDPDHNSTDSAEIKALFSRFERGQLRDGDAQLLARLLRLLCLWVNRGWRCLLVARG